MKLEKLSNMPEPFGVRITDIPPIEEMTRSEWRELGQVALKHLVWTVGGQQNLSKEKFCRMSYSWGKPQNDPSKYQMFESYGDESKLSIRNIMRQTMYGKKLPGLSRISGIKNDDGEFIGMFPEGELNWHSNESAREKPTPVILLHAIEGTEGTQTQFLENVTEYEKLSNHDQKFVDSLICIYEWNDKHILKTVEQASDIEKKIMELQILPKKGQTLKPLIATSPGGHRGFSFNFYTFTKFENKTEKESSEIIDWLKNILLKKENVYTHDWKTGDVVAFDQIVTLHKRPIGDFSKRLLNKIACNFDKIIKDYNENN